MEGKRSRYIRPLRLYFWVSVLFFTAFALRPAQTIKVEVGKGDEIRLSHAPALLKKLRDRADAISGRGCLGPVPPAPVNRLPKAAFFLVPFSALLLKLFWWRRAYVEHLVLALHGHTVLFLGLGACARPVPAPGVVGRLIPRSGCRSPSADSTARRGGSRCRRRSSSRFCTWCLVTAQRPWARRSSRSLVD